MSEHRIHLQWSRAEAVFERGNYSRDHQLQFDNQSLNASSAADFGGNPAHSDPEQLLAASVSSCHMLTFLAVVANRGLVVDSYQDQASAMLEKNNDGQMAVTKIVLNPRVTFSADHHPSTEELAKYHERAHRACFIANSIKCDVEIRHDQH